MIARAFAAAFAVAACLTPAGRLTAQGNPPSWSNVIASLKAGLGEGDQIIYVSNRSDQTIIVNSVTLAKCENVRGACGTRRLNVRIHPGQELQVYRVRQRLPDYRFDFSYSFSWTTEQPVAAPVERAVVAVPVTEAEQAESPKVRAMVAEAVTSDSISSRVPDTVEVTPAQLNLRAGARLELGNALLIVARSKEGQAIPGLRLKVSIEVGGEFAKVESGVLHGLKPGTAVLLISPPPPEDARGEPKGAARILVRVLP